jgi:hypothetical protein
LALPNFFYDAGQYGSFNDLHIVPQARRIEADDQQIVTLTFRLRRLAPASQRHDRLLYYSAGNPEFFAGMELTSDPFVATVPLTERRFHCHDHAIETVACWADWFDPAGVCK